MPILPEYRPTYKIIQILSILKFSSRGSSSSLIRLHLISWALKSNIKRKKLLDPGGVPFKVWGVDPSLNFALEFAIAENLVSRTSNKYKLTDQGKKIVQKIDNENLFSDEILFLKDLGPRITETQVESITKDWL
jgi:hypothetical protein